MEARTEASPPELASPPKLWGWRTWASMAIALGVLAVLIARVDMAAVWRELVATDKRFVLLGALAHYSTYYLRGARWKMVLGRTPRRASRLKYGLIVFFYNFVDNLVPAKLGDIYAAHMAKINLGVRRSEALGSIVFLRMIDAWIVLALAAISSWILFSSQLPQLVVWALGAGGVVALGATMIIVSLIVVQGKMPDRVPEKLRRMVRDLRERVVPSRRYMTAIVIFTVLIWVFEALWIYWLARAFDLHPDVATVLFLTMIPLLASAFPFTPAGAGAVEVAIYSCLIAVGTPVAVATSFTFLNRIVDYWLHIGLGVVAWGIRRRLGMRAWTEEFVGSAPEAPATPLTDAGTATRSNF